MCKKSEKPVLQINFNSPEGNIFFIRQKAADLLRQHFSTDQTKRIEEMITRVEKSSDYEEALAVIGEYVIIVPQGGAQ